jgi:chemotaxis response regulator CheB
VTEADSLSHLVVVGSSAGGIEALSELVSTLPEDLPIPVVIEKHLDPEYSRHVEEYRQIVKSLLIKGIKFFRDPDLFEYLRTESLPDLIEEDVR